MKLYLSGPMSSSKKPKFNYPAFDAAAEALRSMGHDVVNPTECGIDASSPWSVFMRRHIHDLTECHGIVMLDDWNTSTGACIELFIAGFVLGLPVFSIGQLSSFNNPDDPYYLF